MYDPYNDPNSRHYIDPKNPAANLLRRVVSQSRAPQAAWDEFLARVTHPERFAHEVPDEPEQQPSAPSVTVSSPSAPSAVISSPKATRTSGAVARLVALLRDPAETRLTIGTIRARCGIHKANLARTLRTTTVEVVMDAEGWRREGGRYGFALVRGSSVKVTVTVEVTGAHPWDF